jgi:hypothetical protein
MEKQPNAEQYDTSTDLFSVFLGKITNTSPKKINYFLKQTTGVFGEHILPIITPETMGGDVSDYLFGAIKKSFTSDPVTYNKLYDQFDTIYNQTQQASNADDATGAKLLYKFLASQKTTVNDLWKQINAIRGDTSMTYEERTNAEREIRKAINLVYANAIGAYDIMKKSADDYYGMTDNIDTDYMFMNKDLFGAEYALRNYNQSTFTSAQEATAFGINYNDYFDYFVSTKDIDAKDENGNTVNGLKKQRIFEVINAMDISDAQKAYLLGSQYSLTRSDGYYNYDTYARSLLEYVNSMSLTAKQKIDILSEFNCFEINGTRVTIK